MITLNVKRAGMQVNSTAIYGNHIYSQIFQVEPETVATDSFLVNLQVILYRFAEPFMDANYSKVCIFFSVLCSMLNSRLD